MIMIRASLIARAATRRPSCRSSQHIQPSSQPQSIDGEDTEPGTVQPCFEILPDAATTELLSDTDFWAYERHSEGFSGSKVLVI